VSRSRGRSLVPSGRLATGAALAAAALQLSRVAVTTARELSAYRAYDARLRSGWTTIDAVAGAAPLRLHARFRDDAPTLFPPMVLVPGYGVGSRYHVPLAAHLGEHACVYVPDLPGHGRSDHDARPLAIPELAAALGEWIEAADLEPVVLVAHSIGCQVAAELAAARPERVKGVVLVGPTSDPDARTTARTLARGFVASLFDRPSYLLLAGLDYRRAGLRVLRHEMEQMVTHRLEDVLPRIGAPCRVVRGGNDAIVPPSWAQTVARLAGAPAPRVIPGRGHAVHYDEPAAITEVALELAGSLR
jgi:2-hydroxy-6-oxonona-2,4-dienedioate hydrolase